QRRHLAGPRVDVRKTLPADRPHARSHDHRIVESFGRALAHTNEASWVHSPPAARAALVDDRRAARIEHLPGAEISVACALRAGVRVDPGAPGDAREL